MWRAGRERMTMRVGVLASGRGSNLQALLDAAVEPGFPADIALVLSNRPDAYALERAKTAGVPTAAHDHTAFETREGFDRVVDEALRAANIDVVCLAGFMRVLSAWFIQRWAGRVINIHPIALATVPRSASARPSPGRRRARAWLHRPLRQ